MQKTVGRLGSPNLPAARQHRNPLSASPHLENVDLIAGKSASNIAFLPAQNAGENQPARGFDSRQNLNQQLAEQVRNDDVDLSL